jgi:RNA-binding protein PNO1
MKLLVRMNLKKKCVELKSSEHTEETTAIQRAADFLKAFMLGFDIQDAIALLRLDDLYIESFEIKDGIIVISFLSIFSFVLRLFLIFLVKTLHGDHLSRCIGRISGEKGKTKNAIENATRSRIVLAD